MKSCVTVSLVPEAHGGPFVFWDDLPTAIRHAARIGFDAIEIFPPGPEAIDADDLRTRLEDHNLTLAAVGTGAGAVKHKLHLALPDAIRRRKAADYIRSIIDCAAPFGASAIIGSMQGRSGDGVDHGSALGYLADALDELGEHAATVGVPLLFEPLNRYETDQVKTVAEGLALLAKLSTDNVKLLCDLFHMNIEETDIAAALRHGGNAVGHLHFVDSNRRPVGCGHLEFRPILATLREIGYGGYLSAEALPYPNPVAAAEATLRAFRYWTG